MPNKSETPTNVGDVGQPKREASLAAPTGYAAWQLLEIAAECQRNVDTTMCALKCCDYNFAVQQLTVALDKAVLLRSEKERHTISSTQ